MADSSACVARVVRVDRGAVLLLPAGADAATAGDPSGSPAPAAGGAPLAGAVARAAPLPPDLDSTSSPSPVRVALDRDGLVPDADGARHVPTVGDYVLTGTRADGGTTLLELLPRRTVLVRDSAGGTARTQALAANVDVVLVAEHLAPEPEPGRIERLLMLAWRSGARPVVVLTKADLVADGARSAAQVAAVAPGVDVHVVSATAGTGLEPLRALLSPGITVVIVGTSGAGKSTLLNALVGRELMATGALRADGKGRHTTTHRELVVLDSGAVLIDTPGLRAVGVVGGEDAVGAAFADITALAERCRFNDCAHDREPGCAVQAALESGELSARRFDSWRRVAREAAWQARRADHRLAAAETALWKQRAASHRRQMRAR
ncbi:ribosome small subunit-dependent GTPase A [Pengzhenrongella frigida]|uniref:Small ribosomal subunit biogenesis GTPase RsgA n=1 Tax=Pengzhenrongella frigida TaxID=1259133 RepID=A0A4Q5MZZ8_9MICO|nr:ribosome small subunit-dependent GTPase A [Cellulomonas sp. HLT2-17]RYV51452.1 ribosome small subunit-dependent GTPase A [Cellulomonas sp. HLT2-17]